MSWTLACGDVMPGCTAQLSGATRDAVMAAVVAHAAADHGITDPDAETVAVIESKLVEVP